MPSKKKKYNSRFPPARIKKIMQTDDEIGKVSAAVPVLISKCLEMFLASILTHTGEVTKAKRAKTMSTSHLKECIMNVSMFDFLKDVVANVPDMQNEDEPSTSTAGIGEEGKKAIRKRNMSLPKTPKKRAKLGSIQHSASEENENTESGEDGSMEESARDSSNGLLSSSLSSPGHPSPYSHHKQSVSIERSLSSQEKASFHIPLDDLMSPEKVPLLGTENPLQIVTTGSPREERKSKVAIEKLAPGNSTLKKMDSETSSDTLNGEAQAQNAMDLSINSTTLPASKPVNAVQNSKLTGASKANAVKNYHGPKLHIPDPSASRGKTESTPHSMSHLGMIGSPSVIPSPLNMSHLYSPMSLITPPVPPGAHPSPRDLSSKIPQGGMLSFLYSSYPGDASLPPIPQPRHAPPDAHPVPSKADAQPRVPTSEVKSPSMMYPYNPVSEHYKRLASSPHPYMPPVGHERPSAHIPVKPPSKQSRDDDDDYDA